MSRGTKRQRIDRRTVGKRMGLGQPKIASAVQFAAVAVAMDDDEHAVLTFGFLCQLA